MKQTHHQGGEPIRVLYIWKDLATYYGIHDQLLTLARHIDHTRFSPTLCVFAKANTPLRAAFEEAGMPVLSLGLHSSATPSVLPRLTALLRRHAPAVVQTYCLNTNIAGSLAARLAHVPVIIAGELTRRDQAGSPLKRLRDHLLSPLVALAYGIADSVIFVSDHVKCQWVGEHDSPKYRTIYSPFNDRKLADLRPAAPRPIQRDHQVSLGIVARLSPEKGHEDLLRALPRILAAYPRARLLIVGAGPSETFLRHLARRLALSEHIEFRGHRDDIADQMREMDIFVHPSRSEGMGIAIVEAMVLGLPVVATDHGGIPEVVSTGRTGVLVPPRDPSRLAEAVLHLLGNPLEAAQMGERARQCALARFHPRVFARHHEELYRELLRRKSPRAHDTGTLPGTAGRSTP